MFGDVDQEVALLKMFGSDATLGERLEGPHRGCGDWPHGNEDTICVIGVKVLGKLSEVFDANSCLGAEFNPDSACCGGRTRLRLGRKWCVKFVHCFAGPSIESHELTAEREENVSRGLFRRFKYSASGRQTQHNPTRDPQIVVETLTGVC